MDFFESGGVQDILDKEIPNAKLCKQPDEPRVLRQTRNYVCGSCRKEMTHSQQFITYHVRKRSQELTKKLSGKGIEGLLLQNDSLNTKTTTTMQKLSRYKIQIHENPPYSPEKH